jgi:hypothetical protein
MNLERNTGATGGGAERVIWYYRRLTSTLLVVSLLCCLVGISEGQFMQHLLRDTFVGRKSPPSNQEGSVEQAERLTELIETCRHDTSRTSKDEPCCPEWAPAS